jgi:hypothetical protein
MRLARLAAVGLVIGVIAGFAVALLRTRPHAAPPGGPHAGDAERSGERRAEAEAARVLELRAQRQVHG